MKSKINENQQDLYCVWCKNRINFGEKYITIKEEIYGGETVCKEYHPECLPEMEDDE